MVNHFKNSFSRVSTFDELKNIQDNRTVFIHNTLRPFKVSQKFSNSLSKKMKVHEDHLKSSLGLKDDNFIKLYDMLVNPKISLRVIDWFVTNYSKKYNIIYDDDGFEKKRFSKQNCRSKTHVFRQTSTKMNLSGRMIKLPSN